LSFADAWGSLIALCGSLLLARRERSLELAVNEEVAQNSTWTPWHAIGPPFYARRVLFVDEDISALDKICSFTIMWTACNVIQLAIEACFEEEKGVLCRGNVALKRW
jgi:hypothetical protein